ncbi:MAG: hypothetical protein H7A40_03245 [Chlamydiales bacterium]|nr:hypothetical protein [Chlamydiales bacterium]
MICISRLSHIPPKYIIPAGLAVISVALAAIAYLGYRHYTTKQPTPAPKPNQSPLAAIRAKEEQTQKRATDYKNLLDTIFPSLANLSKKSRPQLSAMSALLTIENDYRHGKFTQAVLIEKLQNVEKILAANTAQENAEKEARLKRAQELHDEQAKADAERLAYEQRKSTFQSVLDKVFPDLVNSKDIGLLGIKDDFINGKFTKEILIEKLNNLSKTLAQNAKIKAQEEAKTKRQFEDEKRKIEHEFQENRQKIDESYRMKKYEIAQNTKFELAFSTHCDNIHKATKQIQEGKVPTDPLLFKQLRAARNNLTELKNQYLDPNNQISDETVTNKIKEINESITALGKKTATRKKNPY